jgi:hypothetical protein
MSAPATVTNAGGAVSVASVDMGAIVSYLCRSSLCRFMACPAAAGKGLRSLVRAVTRPVIFSRFRAIDGAQTRAASPCRASIAASNINHSRSLRPFADRSKPLRL